MNVSQPNHVAVIGGGIAGLTAANFAARAGARVTLLERSQEFGGRASSEEREGFILNQGPHALYRGGAADTALTELGIVLEGRTPETAGAAIRSGRRFLLPGTGRSLATTRLLGLRAKAELGMLLMKLPNLDTNDLSMTTVGAWLDATFKQPSVRQLMAALFRLSTYANAPETQSAGAAIEQLKQALASGVRYLDGGWQPMVDALRAKAWDGGVTLRSAARAERLSLIDGGWSIALHTGEPLTADAVIFAIAPKDAASLVDEPRAKEHLSRAAAGAVPVRAACLDIALTRLPRPKATFALGIDEPLYYSVHSASARLAPEGMALVSLAKYLDPANTGEPADTEMQLERLMDLMQPGWRPLLVHRRYLPSMAVTQAQVTGSSGGLAGRPGCAVSGAAGLFVAGDWVGGEGMLADASFASGRVAGESAGAVAALGRHHPRMATA